MILFLFFSYLFSCISLYPHSPLFLSRSLYPSLCLCHPLPIHPLRRLNHLRRFPLTILNVTASNKVCIFLSFTRTLTHTHTHSLSPSLSPPLPPFPSLSPSSSLSRCLCLCLYLCLSISVSISASLSLSLSLSLSVSVSRRVCP